MDLLLQENQNISENLKMIREHKNNRGVPTRVLTLNSSGPIREMICEF